MAEVELKRVTKVFAGGVQAVQDCTLRVADREFLVLVGPSGCGKSTLLRMIAGLEEATSGSIRIGSRVVDDVPPKDRDVAMVFQNYALYPHMSVFDNMAFGLKLRKVSKSEIRERVQQAASILGIEPLLERRPKALSGGQRQRVALGRAIVRQPAVFLFDEPLSNLDALLRVEMRKELSSLHRRLNATIVYVTHDQVEAMTLGDRIAVMHEGIIQQVGRPLDVYDRPANRFVAGFLGTPPMNFLSGRLQRADSRPQFQFGSNSWTLPEDICPADSQIDDDQVATLGIRPEHLHVADSHPSPDTEGRFVAFDAEIEDVQTLGAESLVYVALDGQTLVARVDAHRSPPSRGGVRLWADLGRAHLFDIDGRNIRPG